MFVVCLYFNLSIFSMFVYKLCSYVNMSFTSYSVIIWVQRYGDFCVYEIPHLGYSAYHNRGILHHLLQKYWFLIYEDRQTVGTKQVVLFCKGCLLSL